MSRIVYRVNERGEFAGVPDNQSQTLVVPLPWLSASVQKLRVQLSFKFLRILTNGSHGLLLTTSIKRN